MQTTITTDTQGTLTESYEFVSFGSNCYADSDATLIYTSEGGTKKLHFSKKTTPSYAAAQLVLWGLSASFLAAQPLLENKPKYNEDATQFYNDVYSTILTIGTYKVAIDVNIEQEYNATTEKWDIYTYTPFFLRSSSCKRKVLVVILSVDTDYNDLLTSPEVLAYVEQCRVNHVQTLEEKVLAKLNAELAYEQGRTQAIELLVGATFMGFKGDTLCFLSTDNVEFSVYASMTDYYKSALVVGGNKI